MAKENIGLRGYLGEQIVKFWLRKQNPNYQIISQIMPKVNDPDIKGGAYLDFAVADKGKIIQIIEVKTEDFVKYKSSKKNPSYIYFLKNPGKEINIINQDKEEFQTIPNYKLNFVCLVRPNVNYLLSEEYLINFQETVILYSTILKDINIDGDDFRNYLMGNIKKNIDEVIDTIKNPSKSSGAFKET